MQGGFRSLNKERWEDLQRWFGSKSYFEFVRRLHSKWNSRFTPGLDSDDAVQEAQLRTWQQIQRFEGSTQEEISIWMCRVASRKLKDLRCLAFRRHARDSVIEYIDGLYTDDFLESIAVESPPGEILEEAERDSAVQRARRCLPDLEAQAIELFFFKELPASEVARRLKISTNAVHKRIHSGLERLKAYFRYHPAHRDLVP